jgi:transcriptional regulator with XRE-family HTH domain
MAKTENSLPFDGRRLRRHRERGGLLQADLARLCGEAGHKIDRTRISQLERGDKPSPPLLTALATALNVEIDDLLTPDSEPERKPA